MKVINGLIWCDKKENQLSLATYLGIICLAGFYVTTQIEESLSTIAGIVKGIFVFSALYYLGYALILAKMLTEEHYFKKK
ncbi:MAG: hypothetical protein OH319_04545 [Candidatus Parvarchaeota archaeon]|nr:hypothetical protein [Candidatus Jingweiarchaeum tengchongense]MCW1298675.1 hypothetical protein [Candidatus Jingweiarchaeum tengchongense]MCW1300517.1 hypothetical protein [Candidatus Jingweiarchaeum tengchongense]MCW1304668.1 hypothetical protein [Candidatus Jingweiarchaeum tengchongense]MCW1305857.1 hypothetical protein [Candidatus Jingweiarchaeum tengchongense]